MSNKEIISKVLRKNHALLSSAGAFGNNSKLRAFLVNDENKAIFKKLSYNNNPFLEGIRSAFDIIGEGFANTMREISQIGIDEALLSDAYKVQSDMSNVFEKLTTNVSRERKETIGTASK
ncbi:MAG: hypothetical protein RLZZ306_1119 [Bacteroidota bacterium]